MAGRISRRGFLGGVGAFVGAAGLDGRHRAIADSSSGAPITAMAALGRAPLRAP
ncbi:MAG: twin-arginine translocation signal domain-containing protein, partial [Acidimicrobiales bacterium]